MQQSGDLGACLGEGQLLLSELGSCFGLAVRVSVSVARPCRSECGPAKASFRVFLDRVARCAAMM